MFKLCLNNQLATISTDTTVLNQTTDPIQVFIGGLFHLIGEDTGPSLKGLLHALLEGNPKFKSYYLQEEVVTSWEEKIQQGFRFVNQCILQPAVEKLVDDFLLTECLISPLRSAVQIGDKDLMVSRLRNLCLHMSRINLLGYSYGSSLIQELNWCAQKKLMSIGLTPLQTDEVLSSLVAINIGPVGRFHDSAFGFTQITVVHREDLMSHELCDLQYPDNNTENACITFRRTGNHLLLIPEIGSPVVKAISQINGGTDRRIINDYYEEKHNLFMYLNKTDCQIRTDDGLKMQTFASLPTGELIRLFNALTVNSSFLATTQNQPRIGKQLLDFFQNTYLQKSSLKELEGRFRADQKRFEQEAESKPPKIKEQLWNQATFTGTLKLTKKPMKRPI